MRSLNVVSSTPREQVGTSCLFQKPARVGKRVPRGITTVCCAAPRRRVVGDERVVVHDEVAGGHASAAKQAAP
jgi:hypothetical protein